MWSLKRRNQMEHATADRSFTPRKARLKTIKRELLRQQARFARRVDAVEKIRDPAERRGEAVLLRAEMESLRTSLATLKKALKRKA
jgi:hypothetical protein